MKLSDKATVLGFFVLLTGCAPQAVSDNSICPPPHVYTCAQEAEAANELAGNLPALWLFMDYYYHERQVLAACRNEPPPKCIP